MPTGKYNVNEICARSRNREHTKRRRNGSCVEYFCIFIHICAGGWGRVRLQKIPLIRSKIILWILRKQRRSERLMCAASVVLDFYIGFGIGFLLLHFHISFGNEADLSRPNNFPICVSFVNSMMSSHMHRWTNRCHIELYNTQSGCGIRQDISLPLSRWLSLFLKLSFPLWVYRHVKCRINHAY